MQLNNIDDPTIANSICSSFGIKKQNARYSTDIIDTEIMFAENEAENELPMELYEP
jgi:hypothetical protein